MLVLWADMAAVASGGPAGPEIRPERSALLEHLKEGDPPSPARVVAWVIKQAWVTSRTAYALACYYAVRGGTDQKRREARDEAFNWLAAALPEGVEAEWVARDPSLEPLRARERRRWDRLMEPLSQEPEREGLGELDAIGPHFAKLERARIVFPSTVVVGARTPERRRALAREVSIGPGLLERWARLLALKSRLGIEYAEVNLLDRAGVSSIGALRLLDVPQLGALLDAAVREGVDERPADAVLATWITDAMQRPDDVEPAA